MVYQIIRLWATLFLRLYFRKTIVYGLEHIPRKGPLIVASNHPSAFLEASIMGITLGRPLHYLVRGDMFHPKFQWLFDWTNQIPIYRQKDGISNLRKNASSFELTYRKLADGEAVLIFPEAKTILEKRMRPIQRGTAHLAFGTLPFVKEGEELLILPVGVNFTEPRLPGTDVVVRFGAPFLTEQGTREDRDAIDKFTNTLSESMSPLIIQVMEEGYDHHYDVLASVYMRCVQAGRPNSSAHEDLVLLSGVVNQHDRHKTLLGKVHTYFHDLKKMKISDAVYFPDLVIAGRLLLAIILILKLTWLVCGGWIWRSVRRIIFSKIKTNTFKSPVAIGAAMVLYPLISLILLITCLLTGWPIWIVMVWMMVMISGMFFRPPFYLIWRLLTLGFARKAKLKSAISSIKNEVTSLLESVK
ncbi:MAG: 1-acyl-sn-glycerol-3-phosphate acyltransferase [Saprospiraceae bacterium]|mgnify:CR=1 FL=1|nr:1-acyl-sn-glycerol-3-phosphate acyltransferase [Saprospiraceae bacterium]